jgi:hypothetical protein
VQRSLAFRSSSDNIGTANTDVFLDVLEVIPYLNTALKDGGSKYNAGSVNYLSNKIQNWEIIFELNLLR